MPLSSRFVQSIVRITQFKYKYGMSKDNQVCWDEWLLRFRYEWYRFKAGDRSILNCQDEAFSTGDQAFLGKPMRQRGEIIHGRQLTSSFLSWSTRYYYRVFYPPLFAGEISCTGQG